MLGIEAKQAGILVGQVGVLTGGNVPRPTTRIAEPLGFGQIRLTPPQGLLQLGAGRPEFTRPLAGSHIRPPCRRSIRAAGPAERCLPHPGGSVNAPITSEMVIRGALMLVGRKLRPSPTDLPIYTPLGGVIKTCGDSCSTAVGSPGPFFTTEVCSFGRTSRRHLHAGTG